MTQDQKDKEWEAYDKAWKAYGKAWEVYNKAGRAYLTKYGKEIEELHSTLCPNCPWNGKTIFPNK